MTIRWRLTIWYAATIAVTLTVVGIMVWAQFGRDMRATLEEALAVQASDVAGALQSGDSINTLHEDPARPGIYTVVLDASGTVVMASPSAPSGLALVAPGASTWRPPGSRTDNLLQAVTTPNGLTIVAGSSLAPIDREMTHLAGLLAAIGAAAAAASLGGGWWLARRALAPVAGIVAEADRIHAAGASVGDRLPVPASDDELGHLTATINAMLARVERSLQRQRSFVASASHDLRTPIAALRTELELALRGDATPEQLRVAIGEALGDVERLGTLAEDLLGLAAAEEDGRAVTPVRIGMRELVRDAAGPASVVAAGRAVSLDVDADDRPVVVDRVRVTQAIGNLVSNAVRYSPRGGIVEVRARQVGESRERGMHVLSVDVLDRGPGVAPGDRGMLFVPFSRARTRGGVGLGLATAEAAVRALGGRIGYRDRPGGGAWFWVTVPLRSADAPGRLLDG